MRRAFTALSVVAAAAITPVVAATSAQANQSTCVNYIGNHGYAVGPKVKAACSHPAFQGPLGDGKIPNPDCYSGLVNAGVRGTDVYRACVRA
ncbi:hypothetical protein GCM10011579_015090 [Streptomyces albiflavescens]|uniref:Secreted protein n=2 Tax=Streptomyces albiflavescens TaxID=1623582 RepID=A0A918D116_9ACTN|nr:hypothetical protein GCM10011579_015090 [Streptomyces albiflavescens]